MFTTNWGGGGGGGGGERHRHGARAGTVFGMFFNIHTNLNSKPGIHCLNSESTIAARLRFILAIHSGEASSLPLLQSQQRSHHHGRQVTDERGDSGFCWFWKKSRPSITMDAKSLMKGVILGFAGSGKTHVLASPWTPSH